MNHKRRRPRSTRAGCKMCKPWKKNGWGSRSGKIKWDSDHNFQKWSDTKRQYSADEQIFDFKS